MRDIEKIAKHYGFANQASQLVEEMAELTKALSKMRRSNRDNALIETDGEFYTIEERAVIEEIADVSVMIEQIKYLLNCEGLVACIMRDKIVRQLKRMEEGR